MRLSVRSLYARPPVVTTIVRHDAAPLYARAHENTARVSATSGVLVGIHIGLGWHEGCQIFLAVGVAEDMDGVKSIRLVHVVDPNVATFRGLCLKTSESAFPLQFELGDPETWNTSREEVAPKRVSGLR